MSDADRERTAYHESGHALVGMLTPGADPVRKISIIPRGQALGVTLSTPEGDRYGYSRDELIAKIKVSLGGRAAEKVDLRRDHHRRRVRHPAADEDRARDGRALGDERRRRTARARRRPRGRRQLLPGGSAVSPATQQTVDEEARRIVETAEREVIDLLERERPRLDALAHALLERETLDQPEAYRVAHVTASAAEQNGNGTRPPAARDCRARAQAAERVGA